MQDRAIPYYEAKCPGLDDIMMKSEVILVSKVYQVEAPRFPGVTALNSDAEVRELIYQFCGIVTLLTLFSPHFFFESFDLRFPISDCSGDQLRTFLKQCGFEDMRNVEKKNKPTIIDLILECLGFDKPTKVFSIHASLVLTSDIVKSSTFLSQKDWRLIRQR